MHSINDLQNFFNFSLYLVSAEAGGDLIAYLRRLFRQIVSVRTRCHLSSRGIRRLTVDHVFSLSAYVTVPSSYLVSGQLPGTLAWTFSGFMIIRDGQIQSPLILTMSLLQISCEGEVVKGDAGSWIADEGERLKADVIVVGSSASGVVKR